MTTISNISQTAQALARQGVAFAPEITSAAREHGLDPRLLAAVAAQETGGPGSNSGRNVVGDGGHGRGIFQIDDRYHTFARSAAAMQPQANADYAAGMLAGLLKQYGGDVRKALSAYNSGRPDATGTITPWQDGRRLGYADSVLRHYAALTGISAQTLTDALAAESPQEQQSVNALSMFASLRPPSAPPSPPAQQQPPPARSSPSREQIDFASLVDPDGDSSD